MEKKKLNLIAGVLIVIFILVLFSQFSRLKPRTKKSRKTTPQLSTEAVSLAQKNLEEYFASLGIPRNPFILGGKVPKWRESTEETSQELNLNAIVWDETQPLAVINNEIFTVGQESAGLKVISIEKDKVIVEKEGETIELVISIIEGNL
ncbi:MAG: hypothetical protein AB7E08_03795 [Candidatus Omnitrophota bacterium]